MLAHIELPLIYSLIGIPVIGALVTVMAHQFFGIAWWLSTVAILLVFFFCLIAINSTGLTSITPIGAMGKLTQLTFGALAPRNMTVNLMTAGICGEVASHAANLLQDIKPGYMLGGKPRQQALGHILGIVAGAVLSIPVFYLLFLELPASQLTAIELNQVDEAGNPVLVDGKPVPVPYKVDEKKYPMPAATIWQAVAEVLAKGFNEIMPSARIAAVAGLLIGLALETCRILTKNRFPLSAVAIGLGFVIPFHMCLSMFIGSLSFWCLEQVFSSKESQVNRVIVQNQEPICAGLIAGGSLMGIAVAVAELLLKASK